MRFCLVLFSLGIFALCMLISANNNSIDNKGHFLASDMAANGGGFITGLVASLVAIKGTRPEANHHGSFEKKVTYVGLGCTAIYFITMFLVFFLAADRKQVWFY